jgi:hypothetical protein
MQNPWIINARRSLRRCANLDWQVSLPLEDRRWNDCKKLHPSLESPKKKHASH